ncbi:MAG: Aspartate aminotransferase [Alphaproteobacteria bacterium MarineAlpha5_Bin11]|nr:aspartate aminotransferase [Pelagibacteraceae bacterium]PPR44300.1 MAG: Aspartate aminotransferase [Alphaproteobacteria bacterium MarineAlpha5_Bin11]PPR52012.1 MAG: Aspartate aminotransferase [Alphaproteobacteria bacterium MarineAlpha5_Bin10]|tara:strand:- start:13840 stop:15045 length:1206 start_codon:yes stop_codon:yes gene_type:complete
MKEFISERIKKIRPSLTVAVNVKANSLRAEGRDVLVLAAGEPDFDTPKNIQEAAIRAMQKGETRYVPGKGTVELQEAIINKYKNDNDLIYSKDEITVGVGGKHIIFNAMMATINEGDEVIIPAPYWVSYPDIALLADGVPVIVKCEQDNDFKITAEQLEKNITEKTKWFMLNSPSNPTGSMYSLEELQSIAKILIKHPQILILTDDIYEKIIYEKNKFYTIAQVEPRLKDRTLTMNGVSKAYCMTGWRLGYVGGPAEIISAMNKIQSQSTTSTSSITMAAAVEALNGDQGFITEHNNAFQKRRDMLVEMLNKAKGITCSTPTGAFYVYPNCSGCINKITPNGETIKTDEDFMNYMLESEGVAGVHGSAFGLSPFFRISYATSETILKDACMRIIRACNNLK